MRLKNFLITSAFVAVSLIVGSQLFAQGPVNILTRGTGGVGSLLIGVGSSASGVGLDALLFTGSGAPTSGTTGTRAGQAGPMSKYIDVTNFRSYINANTKASPTWVTTGDSVTGGLQYAEVALTNAQ